MQRRTLRLPNAIDRQVQLPLVEIQLHSDHVVLLKPREVGRLGLLIPGDNCSVPIAPTFVILANVVARPEIGGQESNAHVVLHVHADRELVRAALEKPRANCGPCNTTRV